MQRHWSPPNVTDVRQRALDAMNARAMLQETAVARQDALEMLKKRIARIADDDVRADCYALASDHPQRVATLNTSSSHAFCAALCTWKKDANPSVARTIECLVVSYRARHWLVDQGGLRCVKS